MEGTREDGWKGWKGWKGKDLEVYSMTVATFSDQFGVLLMISSSPVFIFGTSLNTWVIRNHNH